jgi:hypothetical protein
MCHQVTCRNCGKASWAGCGRHVQQVMAGIPDEDRCACTPEERKAARRGSLWDRLLGR